MKQKGIRRRRQGALERLEKALPYQERYRQAIKKDFADGKIDHDTFEAKTKKVDSDEKRMKREIATLKERLS